MRIRAAGTPLVSITRGYETYHIDFLIVIVLPKNNSVPEKKKLRERETHTERERQRERERERECVCVCV